MRCVVKTYPKALLQALDDVTYVLSVMVVPQCLEPISPLQRLSGLHLSNAIS